MKNSRVGSTAATHEKHQDAKGVTVFYINQKAGTRHCGIQAEHRTDNCGVFIALLELGLSFIPKKESVTEITVKIIVTAGMGAMGLYFVLDGIVSRVYLEPERLVYRNFCGMRKAVCWKDIK